MKRIIFVFLAFLVSILCSEMYAQTFQVTDYELPKDASSRTRRDCEEQLGSIINLVEFDKSVKLQEDNGGSIVLYLQNDGSYRVDDPTRDAVGILTIEKIMGYYRSLKFQVWKNNRWAFTLTLKRK